MKKIAIMLLAALMLFAFVACDDNNDDVKEEPVKLAEVQFGDAAFSNPSGVGLTSTDGKNFTVTGTLGKMTQEQANAFETLKKDEPAKVWQKDSQYIALNIEVGEDASVVTGWVKAADAKTTGALDAAKWVDRKPAEGKKDLDGTTYGMVLAITNGSTPRSSATDATKADLTNNSVWRIEITNGTSDTVTVYTVDLSAQIKAADEAFAAAN